MDFGITGTASPRAYQRQLPGSARSRPSSVKPVINPITGQEMTSTPTPRQQVLKQTIVNSANAKQNSVPSLNLHYLKDDDIKTGAIDIDLNDYSLDSPDSVSTISWGTGRSVADNTDRIFQLQNPSKSTQRPEGVPGLNLAVNKHGGAKKQPSYWDKKPVPDDLPQPSARHKEMYQQYADEMKTSYRAQANSARVKQKEVENARQAVKVRECEEVPEQDIVSDKWTHQRYSGKQLLKKLDAEDLLEHNKKQKLVETVMIDQLSRAVISDPEQNQRSTYRPGSTSARRGRGSNRFLHDSKISTSSTATENLLSKRVRFGARILTRNGHNAMRELTGFYFNCDNTLTVYEFRQFGKSAKAMPFIYRGCYLHTSGPKQDKPYSLTDIYPGANLKIPTKGQLALTDSLTESSMIVLRVTDIDEAEKDILLVERDDDERLHAPSKLDFQNREFLYAVQDEVCQQICKRGIKTITGLGRFYRNLDQYDTGILDQFDLEKGLRTFRIQIDPDKLEDIFEILDPAGTKLLDYGEYIHGVIGEMSEYRKTLVRKAFKKVSSGRKGEIHVSDIKKFFNANATSQRDDTGMNALQAFLEAVRQNDRQEFISVTEFEEYYEGLSLGVESDEGFANILRNTWNV